MSTIATFSNPIIPGFAPDPSCIFVNNTYYLVNSSFHVFPGLPIYRSENLQDWKLIGNAIHRHEQFDFTLCTTTEVLFGKDFGLTAAAGLMAPTIRHHKGTFYIICTHVIDGEPKAVMRNFYVTTKDIESGYWSDPIFVDFQGIDPSIFFDDDGKVYFQGSLRPNGLEDPLCTIAQVEIDIATGKHRSPLRRIWNGWAGKDDAEGPHVYKKDGWYWLLTAEAGTFEHHLIAMGRSSNVWGPYEALKSNPLLTAAGTDKVVQNTGHGDLFQGKDGQWWCVCLGVRNVGERYPLGRETFLTPVSWPHQGLPQIGKCELQFTRQLGGSAPPRSGLMRFPDQEDLYIRSPNPGNYRISVSRTMIRSTSSDLDARTGSPSFIGRRQRTIDLLTTATLVDAHKLRHVTKAGMALYLDDRRYLAISYDATQRTVQIDTKLPWQELETLKRTGVSGAKHVGFRLEASLKRYDFLYRVNGSWVVLHSFDTRTLTEMSKDFTGPIVGVFAVNAKERKGEMVTFQGFHS